MFKLLVLYWRVLIVIHLVLEALPKLTLYQKSMSKISFQCIMICSMGLIASFVLALILLIQINVLINFMINIIMICTIY